jgi:hypothetical protein
MVTALWRYIILHKLIAHSAYWLKYGLSTHHYAYMWPVPDSVSQNGVISRNN